MTKLYSKEIKIVFLIFIFKIILLSLVPLTGDEAYFIKWGNTLSMGYYDHPPMVGWLIYLMSFVSDNYIFYRLFSVVTTFIVTYLIYKIAELYMEQKRAFYIGLLFLASPVDILISLFTNDVALLLFGTLGVFFLLYSFEKEKKILYALLSGLFLGFAFLSKYFAAFLLISLLIFVFIKYKTKAIKNVLIISVIVLLAIAQNLYFNYNSCWNNIMFNFFARTQSEYNLETLGNFFLNLTYLVTPWGFYFLYKSRKNFKNNDLMKLIASILILIFIVFFMVALKNELGIHWFILFVPYLFLLFSFLDDVYLKKLFKYNYIFTFVHIAILFIALSIPTSLLKEQKYYSDIIYATSPELLCEKFEQYSDEEFFTLGYTTASMLSYSCNRDIKMLFNDSKFGRMDDKLLDVRSLETKDIYLFDNHGIEEHELSGVCAKVSIEEFDIKGAKFHMAKCSGFDYASYKKEHLELQKKRFYTIPKWLPIGKCYFLDKYYNGKRD
ncbi:glycosyltransferase family 39 protein [Sulfurimonas sp.]|uniref:glycosyltransferase family 39 protein n=1 Tax=Sulfurimonas sp. TaxID=2022749 RepID=UPI002B487FBB|nr:glycosyltransferase family 39 protein [Sulfurimonas sp.]